MTGLLQPFDQSLVEVSPRSLDHSQVQKQLSYFTKCTKFQKKLQMLKPLDIYLHTYKSLCTFFLYPLWTRILKNPLEKYFKSSMMHDGRDGRLKKLSRGFLWPVWPEYSIFIFHGHFFSPLRYGLLNFPEVGNKKSDTPEWHHKPHFMGQMVRYGVKGGIGENMWYSYKSIAGIIYMGEGSRERQKEK